ncbi:hypothetical protein CEXT_135471 [Caerostris extrusa]|uniref:Uncharacterized protein n=1 Tax=Caerostris extrusa TaxID=172846 RepID=A0AAV4UEB8_CAEEX|nr:hypothetical protein CEXT_135471 [Caerostris extrusa]
MTLGMAANCLLQNLRPCYSLTGLLSAKKGARVQDGVLWKHADDGTTYRYARSGNRVASIVGALIPGVGAHATDGSCVLLTSPFTMLLPFSFLKVALSIKTGTQKSADDFQPKNRLHIIEMLHLASCTLGGCVHHPKSRWCANPSTLATLAVIYQKGVARPLKEWVRDRGGGKSREHNRSL